MSFERAAGQEASGWQDTHLNFIWVGGCPKDLHHYRDMAEEGQITVQVEETCSPVEPAHPTPLHLGDKCEAIVVQKDGCP